jgi:hypothetical protein
MEEMQLVNFLGQSVKKIKATQSAKQSIDVSNLATGNYFVLIKTKDERSFKKRVIVGFP